jgi:hypothetical protein
MDYFKINGRNYDVIVTEIEETFTILFSENTGRTLARGAKMTLDPLGTFFGHKVTVKRKNGFESVFDELYDFISTPRYDGVPVEIVHNQTTISYSAYISQGARKLSRIDEKTGKVYWGEITINIIPMEAQVTPE